MGFTAEPTVTVCVPTIGRTATLRATLESLKRQTYSNYEVLVLDNATEPDARKEISRYVAGEERASVLRSPVRLPMFDNFQRGIDAASGRYLAFFHDDDVYAVDFLADQVRFLEGHQTVAFAGSNCGLIDAAGRPVGNRELIHKTEAWPGWRYIDALFALGSNVFPMQSIMFRRDALGGQTFDSSKGVHFSDFVILMRLAEKHDVGLINAQLIQLRTHDEQASRQLDISESLRLRTVVFNAYCDELLSRWPERRSDVSRLRRHIRSARRSTAVWSWLSATDPRSTMASRAVLADQGADRWLRGSLELADRIGLGRLLRTPAVQTKLRNAGRSLAARIR